MADAVEHKVPEAETLKPATNGSVATTEPGTVKGGTEHRPATPKRRLAYRPSHKATFIGIAVVIVILGVNAGIVGFLIKQNNAQSKALSDKGVSISPGVLSKLGVNDSQIGNQSEQLTVDPKALFNSGVTVAGDLSVSGQFHLNSTLSATSASLNQLQAGNTSVSGLNVNGNATASNLSLRGSFNVSGPATFQNTLTVNQLFSANNGAAIGGNLSVGGTITATTVATRNLELTGSFIFGSHIETSGTSPSIGPGSALGAYGTVSISGDDAAGVIDVNLGAGGSGTNGVLAHIAFKTPYTSMPRVVVTPVGTGALIYVSSITTSGFDVDVGSIPFPVGGYQIDYITEQ